MKDYYFILGCKENVTTDEIKIAYRKLSKKFHPDINNGDKFFEERFKEIQEAYHILGNETKRSAYDYKRKNRDTATYNRGASRYAKAAAYQDTTGDTDSSPSINNNRAAAKKKTSFSSDMYYTKYKMSGKTKRHILRTNAKKLLFFVIIPMALIFTSMNYISTELNRDISNEQAPKTKWVNAQSYNDMQPVSSLHTVSPIFSPDKKQTATWILKKLNAYSQPVSKRDFAGYSLKQDGYSFNIDDHFFYAYYTETKQSSTGHIRSIKKYCFRVPIADIDKVVCEPMGLNIIASKKTIQQIIPAINETTPTNQLLLGFRYNAETDLDSRMVNAFNHLKTFYPLPL